jgi:hypothetical protein
MLSPRPSQRLQLLKEVEEKEREGVGLRAQLQNDLAKVLRLLTHPQRMGSKVRMAGPLHLPKLGLEIGLRGERKEEWGKMVEVVAVAVVEEGKGEGMPKLCQNRPLLTKTAAAVVATKRKQ